MLRPKCWRGDQTLNIGGNLEIAWFGHDTRVVCGTDVHLHYLDLARSLSSVVYKNYGIDAACQ